MTLPSVREGQHTFVSRPYHPTVFLPIFSPTRIASEVSLDGSQTCTRRCCTSGFRWSCVADVAAETTTRKYVIKKGPEARLYIALVAAFLLPTGMFIYAWTAIPTIHWIVPLFGLTVSPSSRLPQWRIDIPVDRSSWLARSSFTRSSSSTLPTGTPSPHHFTMIKWRISSCLSSYGPYASSALAGQSLCRTLSAPPKFDGSDVFDFVLGLISDAMMPNRESSRSGLPTLYATHVRYSYVQVGEHALCTHFGGYDSYSLCQFFFHFFRWGFPSLTTFFPRDLAHRSSSYMALRSGNGAKSRARYSPWWKEAMYSNKKRRTRNEEMDPSSKWPQTGRSRTFPPLSALYSLHAYCRLPCLSLRTESRKFHHRIQLGIPLLCIHSHCHHAPQITRICARFAPNPRNMSTFIPYRLFRVIDQQKLEALFFSIVHYQSCIGFLGCHQNGVHAKYIAFEQGNKKVFVSV